LPEKKKNVNSSSAGADATYFVFKVLPLQIVVVTAYGCNFYPISTKRATDLWSLKRKKIVVVRIQKAVLLFLPYFAQISTSMMHFSVTIENL